MKKIALFDRLIIEHMPSILESGGGKIDFQFRKLAMYEEYANCVTTRTFGNNGLWYVELKQETMKEAEKNYCIVENEEGKKFRLRIRKLTPKECLRLMDVRDEDADKMMQVNSNAQCYKQAGNSIVVACMEKIFHNLFIEPKEERPVIRMRQLSMFD